MMSTTTAAIRLGQLRHALLVGCLLSGSAGAETLQQAWEAALTADRGLRAAQQNTAAAASLVQAAEAARLPGVSLEAGYTALDNAPTLRVELGGASQQFAVAQRESYAYRAMATLPLYTGGRITSGIEASKASLNAARYGEAGEMQELKLRVAEAFTTVLRTTQGLAVANSHVASLQAHATDVQNLFEQGVVARNDLLAAQVALADARQQAIQAANAVDITRAAYNRLLGRPLDQGVTLDEIAPQTANDPLPAVTERALRQRPELGALADQIRALRHQATAVRAETAPQVALSGGYGYQENRYQVYPGQWSATLGARWNLFDGGMAKSPRGCRQSPRRRRCRSGATILLPSSSCRCARPGWISRKPASVSKSPKARLRRRRKTSGSIGIVMPTDSPPTPRYSRRRRCAWSAETTTSMHSTTPYWPDCG